MTDQREQNGKTDLISRLCHSAQIKQYFQDILKQKSYANGEDFDKPEIVFQIFVEDLLQICSAGVVNFCNACTERHVPS